MMLVVYMMFSSFFCLYYLPKVYQFYAITYFERQGDQSVVSYFERVFLLVLSLVILFCFLSISEINKTVDLYYLLVPVALSISYFDLKFRVIPDRFHLISICLIVTMMLLKKTEIDVTQAMNYGFAFVFLFFLIISNLFYAKFRKQDGIGWGDIKLLVWMALVLKESVIGVFFVSVLLSLFFHLIKKIIRRGYVLKDSFAFAPYLMGVFLFVLLS